MNWERGVFLSLVNAQVPGGRAIGDRQAGGGVKWDRGRATEG